MILTDVSYIDACKYYVLKGSSSLMMRCTPVIDLKKNIGKFSPSQLDFEPSRRLELELSRQCGPLHQHHRPIAGLGGGRGGAVRTLTIAMSEMYPLPLIK